MNTAYNFLKDYVPLHNAVKTREDGDFLVALNRNNEIYYLNGTAREMWEILDGTVSIEGLCSKILSEYDIDRKSLEYDIVSFIRDLQWKKLIRIKTGGILS
ncbi:MAG: PqqD family protein [Synergistaceae bacterium]|nr:PqqD family protein [Synergistaceae bacterium]